SGSTAPGVVTSMQLQDDSGGSISLDFVGSTTNRVQANYYVDGQVDLGNPVSSVVSSDPVSNYNEYRILWQPDSISWYVNGAVIRTVHRADTWAEGLRKFTFPQKAARLSFSIWDASGSTNPYLTTAWAGSIPSSKTGAQFTAYIKSVSIKCYSNSTSTSTSSSPLGNTAHQNSNHKQSSANASSVVPASASDSDDDDLSDFGRGDSNSSLENQSSSGSSRKDGIDQISAYLERNVNSSAAASHLQGFSVISAAAAVILATAIASI
ncbi:putative glycosidase CRH2, partial [Linderina pennispora]